MENPIEGNSLHIQLVYVAVKLGIADLLKEGPKTSTQLATAVNAHPQSLFRVLRALSALGIFSQTEEDLFDLTPLSERLQKDAPNTMYYMALWEGEGWSWKPTGELLHNVKTGEAAFNHLFGKTLFEYLGTNTQDSEVFNEAMDQVSRKTHPLILEAYDFSKFKKIIEIGGGRGRFIASILKINPELQGELFDLPAVGEGAQHLLEQEGVKQRCKVTSGNAVEFVPAGGDAYILINFIHGCNDEDIIRILKNCRNAMSNKGRLILIERLILPGTDGVQTKVFDIEMMLYGGQQRTEIEYKKLLEKAGFTLAKVIPTKAEHYILEGHPH